MADLKTNLPCPKCGAPLQLNQPEEQPRYRPRPSDLTLEELNTLREIIEEWEEVTELEERDASARPAPPLKLVSGGVQLAEAMADGDPYPVLVLSWEDVPDDPDPVSESTVREATFFATDFRALIGLLGYNIPSDGTVRVGNVFVTFLEDGHRVAVQNPGNRGIVCPTHSLLQLGRMWAARSVPLWQLTFPASI